MKRFGSIALVVAASLGACQEPDPNFGDPNGIWGKKLPGEKATAGPSTSSSGGDTPPALTTSLAQAHATTAGVAGGAPAADKPSDCAKCHQGTPGPQFAFGGRVETDGKGVAGVVIAVDGLGPVQSDADGYFWQKTGAIADGAKVTARKGTDPATPMGGALTKATGDGCLAAKCHGATPPGPIHP